MKYFMRLIGNLFALLVLFCIVTAATAIQWMTTHEPQAYTAMLAMLFLTIGYVTWLLWFLWTRYRHVFWGRTW